MIVLSDLVDISNPNHPARRFIQEAESHVGAGGHAWVQSMTSIGGLAWCAATCCAVAKACGFADICMPSANYLAAGFGAEVVNKYGGTRIDGPIQGGDGVPQVGDFVIYQKPGYGPWDGYHIGMVRSCEGDTVYTVEGNTTGSTYSFREKNRLGSNIGWYARPDWTKVGGIVGESSIGFGMGGDLYTTRSSKADASIREVCYLSSSGKPSISPTDVKLSVLNYTNLLADIVKTFGVSSGSGSPDNIDGLPSVAREIVSFLTGKGLPTSAAIGIIGNIQAESEFNTAAVGDHGTSFGMCQWHNERGTAMKAMAGSNWASNLTGQCEYLWHELNGGYSRLLSILQDLPNTLEGAKTAADKFVRLFEIPANVDHESVVRQGNAEAFWNMVVVAPASNAGSTNDVAVAQTRITTQSGTKVTSGTSVKVPSSVSQTGIIPNYTSYTGQYGRWAKGSVQRKLSEVWASQGKPQSHHICTIDGYYLIALAQVFGTTGDLVSVVLEDGTYFNAILADAKGADAHSHWGHIFGSQVDIVEWEAYGNDQSALRNGLKEAGWSGKKVNRIVNYGSWLSGARV